MPASAEKERTAVRHYHPLLTFPTKVGEEPEKIPAGSAPPLGASVARLIAGILDAREDAVSRMTIENHLRNKESGQLERVARFLTKRNGPRRLLHEHHFVDVGERTGIETIEVNPRRETRGVNVC